MGPCHGPRGAQFRVPEAFSPRLAQRTGEHSQKLTEVKTGCRERPGETARDTHVAELGSDRGPPSLGWKEPLTDFWLCTVITKLVQVCGFKKKKTPKDPQQLNKPNQSRRRGSRKGTSLTPGAGTGTFRTWTGRLREVPGHGPLTDGARCTTLACSLRFAWPSSCPAGGAPRLPPPAWQLRSPRAVPTGDLPGWHLLWLPEAL